VRASDPRWADDPVECVAHYWAWRGRRWLFDDAIPAAPAVARMEQAREMCVRRHGFDPQTATRAQGRPRDRDDEGRTVDR
jgi:hypothetical protein